MNALCRYFRKRVTALPTAAQQQLDDELRRVQEAVDCVVNNSGDISCVVVDTAQDARDLDISYDVTIRTLGALTKGDGGGGLFYWDATSNADDNLGTVLLPTGRVGPGRRLRDTLELTPQMFGCDATGVVDCTAAMQRAIDASGSEKKRLVIDNGTFKIAGTTNTVSTTFNYAFYLNFDDIDIYIGASGIINSTAEGCLFFYDPTQMGAPAPPQYALQETIVDEGANSITLSNAGYISNFSAGDWISIEAGETLSGFPATKQPIAEWVKIRAIAGGTIYFYGTTIGEYYANMTAEPGALRISKREGNYRKNLKITGPGTIKHYPPSIGAVSSNFVLVGGPYVGLELGGGLKVETTYGYISMYQTHSYIHDLRVSISEPIEFYAISAATGTTRTIYENIYIEATGVPILHFHEGASAIAKHIHISTLGGGNPGLNMISMRSFARKCLAENISINTPHVESPAAFGYIDPSAIDCSIINSRFYSADDSGAIIVSGNNVTAANITAPGFKSYSYDQASLNNLVNSGYVKFLRTGDFTAGGGTPPTKFLTSASQLSWIMPNPASNAGNVIPILHATVTFPFKVGLLNFVLLVSNKEGTEAFTTYCHIFYGALVEGALNTVFGDVNTELVFSANTDIQFHRNIAAVLPTTPANTIDIMLSRYSTAEAREYLIHGVYVIPQ